MDNRPSKPRWSGLSLEIGDNILVWDEGKRVKAHKDKLCNGARNAMLHLKQCFTQCNIARNARFHIMDQPCGSLMFRYKNVVFIIQV